jgi:hypothetical protein
MTVKLELTPDVQAGLLAQAQTEVWEQELDSWLDGFPQGTVLPEQAFQRDDWYADRW